MAPVKVARQDSQSLIDPEMNHKSKRQKLGNEYGTYASTSTSSNNKPISTHMAFDFGALATKNAALKGRKRFNADLDSIKDACSRGSGIVGYGLQVSRFNAGDDEGLVELAINVSPGREEVLAVGVLVSDTSEYPKSHLYFAHCLSSDDPPPAIQAVVASISETCASKSLVAMLERLLKDISKTRSGTSPADPLTVDSDSEAEDTEPDDSGDYYDDDDESDHLAAAASSSLSRLLPMTSPDRFNKTKLQMDFIETLASSYRPGVIRTGDGFVMSVSLPIIDLAEKVEPRALGAWDRKLLNPPMGIPHHLVLLISGWRGVYPYPIRDARSSSSASSSASSSSLKFKVGLSSSYKPTPENVREAYRSFGLIVNDAEDELALKLEKERFEALAMGFLDSDDLCPSEVLGNDDLLEGIDEENVDEEPEKGTFESFALSSSLESLMDQHFLKLVGIRMRWALGWAGAETLLAECEKRQAEEKVIMGDAFMNEHIKFADQTERNGDRDPGNGNGNWQGRLPFDPLQELQQRQGEGQEINLPLTAFSYLVRRLVLCTRFCLVCHRRLSTDFEALKPYVCDSKLCSYQYYSLGMGPKLEYEIIHNPVTVDLLTSLTYAAAIEGVLDEPLPTGMGLRVPPVGEARYMPPPQRTLYVAMSSRSGTSTSSTDTATPSNSNGDSPKIELKPGTDGLVDFDALDGGQMRVAIVKLIASLPAIEDIKKHLERKVKLGKSKPTLKEMDSNILPAAWLVLRWIIGSCTADLEEITSEEECIKGADRLWHQFRFSVGAPDAEARFKDAVKQAQQEDPNTREYPSLFAWHGSPLRNWHSIIRHGLWFKHVANGRAFGDGVYLAKEASTSMHTYATAGHNQWPNSRSFPTSCVALAEVVNLPRKFVSSNPHFVVKDTHWIMCRYLLVKCSSNNLANTGTSSSHKTNTTNETEQSTPFVRLDPAHHITLHNKAVEIPAPGFQLEQMLNALRSRAEYEDNDEGDQEVFDFDSSQEERERAKLIGKGKGKEKEVIEISDDEDADGDFDDMDGDIEMYDFPAPAPPPSSLKPLKPKPVSKPLIDWVHDPDWVRNAVPMLLPAPQSAERGATARIQRELRGMLNEQENCSSLKELGWYMPEEFIGDNLFQWIIELHSFDESIPIAVDMKREKINSVIFEIRFPPDFPLSPPFFRIITPRFLPFIQGGGGHVTGGGSICMDLLTASGWLPSYSIPAIIMQIKLALSNLDPRPARLAHNWRQNYGVSEALMGYKRAAATHNWKLPSGIDQLVR
ncbi:hypothetical protein K435DRAFT_829796 [Dendrothele bispora CBS 962.96]|uniref:UBC core domain-containing protein n=1 Tax=Dendrothele bispora (strain CBS 962.96) TaxID=1314807 RepID=A0A4S8LRH4_DENBC|nr:hypothetical protein K435DRAFT_829796 [Dendrothele bispora CBS 962.96]